MSAIKCHAGGQYRSYAPGHGALHFVHVQDGQATGREVPMSAMKRLTPPGWKLTRHTGQWEAYRPVRRVDINKLEMSFNDEPARVYMHRPAHAGHGGEFYYQTDMGWEPTRNQSRIASLQWFVANESRLDIIDGADSRFNV